MRTIFILSVISFILLSNGCERPITTNQTDLGIPPAVPTGLIVYYASDGEVLLLWHRNKGLDLEGYNIYRSTDSTRYSKIGFTSQNYYYDDSLSYDSTYYYEIASLDIWNKESLRTLPVSAKPINRYAPEAPKNLQINARNWQGKLSVYLNWDPAVESDVSHYKIYRDTTANFIVDSSIFTGISYINNFTDSTGLNLYTDYYYRVKAVDKGGLISKESSEVNDRILGIPKLIFPHDNSIINYFPDFKIIAIKIPTTYNIIVQDNKFFGTFWQKKFNSNIVNNTIQIPFIANYIQPNITYYWRIATYSHQTIEPNSVSPLYKFIIKQ